VYRDVKADGYADIAEAAAAKLADIGGAPEGGAR
jgi:hypothetical protein